MTRSPLSSAALLIGASFALVVSSSGCRGEGAEEHDGPDAVEWSDHDALFLIETLPMGLTVDEVLAIIPSAEIPQSGEGQLSHLSSTTVDGRVLGHPGSIELNFANGILYSYYFRIEPSCAEAERLTDLLRTRYTAEYGRGVHEAEQRTGYATDSSFWDAVEADVALTLGRQDDQCRLAWGFQDAHP